ncbi:MAG: hypothetical protein E3J72_04520 [Planctomycetota bacterium]|nr:MAG: hypothetical protein E3J72_04520 [Planctomycetota bacterium]
MKRSLFINFGIAITLFFTMTCITGCAYLKDRGSDAADIFTAHIGLGYGLSAHAVVGPLGIGFGGAKAKVAGMRDREIFFWNDYTELGFPLSNIHIFNGFYEPEGAGFCYASGLSLTSWLYVDDPAMWTVFFLGGPMQLDAMNKPEWVYFVGDVHVSATAGFVTVRVGVNVIELIDFIVGWTTADIAGDDEVEWVIKKPESDEKEEAEEEEAN